MDKLLKDAMDVASDAWARKATDNQEQIVTVTRHNVKAAFSDAINKTDEITLEDGQLELIANAAFAGLKKSLARSRLSELSESLSDSNKVVFKQTKTTLTPFRNMKKAGKAKLKELLGIDAKKPLPGSLNNDIDMGAQRLHTTGSLTVGITRLKRVTEILDSKTFGTKGAKFTSSKAFKNMFEKYGDIFADIKIVPDRKGGKKIEYKGKVSISVRKKAANFPGSEDDDWTNIQPLLKEAIVDFLGNIKPKLSNIEGSKSIREESVEHARNISLAPLLRIPGIRSKSKLTKNKKKTKKGDTTTKSKPFSAAAGTAVSIAKGRKKKAARKGSEKASLFQLVALINKELPDTVRKNMNSPGLENRTGRFAASVKLTDAMMTPKGYPSFGYTYQKEPYGTFEVGQGRAPWATPDRDPRKIIDASIREIAANMALGRFYTRRM
jgi:hypothetical protein